MVLNIIKAELYRLVRSKVLYIVLLVIMSLSILSIWEMEGGTIGVASDSSTPNRSNYEKNEKLKAANSIKEIRDINKSYEAYDVDKCILGSNGNLYYAFVAIIGIILAKEFSSKTIKNSLSSSISRKKYFFSKLLFILGTATVIIFFADYFTHFMNLIINGKEFTADFIEITKLAIIQLPILYGTICLLVCLNFVTRKTSVFYAIAIPCIVVFQLLLMDIPSLLNVDLKWFEKYEIKMVLVNLAGNPSTDYVLKCGLLGISYMVVFSVIGYYVFKKVEIK